MDRLAAAVGDDAVVGADKFGIALEVLRGEVEVQVEDGGALSRLVGQFLGGLLVISRTGADADDAQLQAQRFCCYYQADVGVRAGAEVDGIRADVALLDLVEQFQEAVYVAEAAVDGGVGAGADESRRVESW